MQYKFSINKVIYNACCDTKAICAPPPLSDDKSTKFRTCCCGALDHDCAMVPTWQAKLFRPLSPRTGGTGGWFVLEDGVDGEVGGLHVLVSPAADDKEAILQEDQNTDYGKGL